MGVRDADWLTLLASRHGLQLRADVAMPANNRLLVFAADATADAAADAAG
jgi:hypothetical protein